MIFKKIIKEEFEKLKVLFPSNNGMWEKYKKIRVEQLEKNEIDVFVIEKDNKFIGEITVNYKNTELETETIPNRRGDRIAKYNRLLRLEEILYN